MVRLSAHWRHAIHRFRGLLLTGGALAFGTAIWTNETHAQFLGQDAVTGDERGAVATGRASTAVGRHATATGDGSTAVGAEAASDGKYSTTLGKFSQAKTESTALGSYALANFIHSTAIGVGSETTRDNQMVFGRTTNTHTAPGIVTEESRTAQRSSMQFVTSDSYGNLATDGEYNSRRIGIGTWSPDANSKLEIRSMALNNGLLAVRDNTGPHYLRVENTAGVFRAGLQQSGDAQFGALTAGKGLNLLAGGSGKVAINASGQISFGNNPPAISTHALVHQSGAHLTTGGVWTSVSSRAAKQDIEPITSDEARETVRALQPVGYRYKNELDERYVGFIAEDVPELVATRDRKGLAPMDITAVLTKVVQDQDKLLITQQTKLEKQDAKLEKQDAMIASLVERLAAIERANAVAAKPE